MLSPRGIYSATARDDALQRHPTRKHRGRNLYHKTTRVPIQASKPAMTMPGQHHSHHNRHQQPRYRPPPWDVDKQHQRHNHHTPRHDPPRRRRPNNHCAKPIWPHRLKPPPRHHNPTYPTHHRHKKHQLPRQTRHRRRLRQQRQQGRTHPYQPRMRIRQNLPSLLRGSIRTQRIRHISQPIHMHKPGHQLAGDNHQHPSEHATCP